MLSPWGRFLRKWGFLNQGYIYMDPGEGGEVQKDPLL